VPKTKQVVTRIISDTTLLLFCPAKIMSAMFFIFFSSCPNRAKAVPEKEDV